MDSLASSFDGGIRRYFRRRKYRRLYGRCSQDMMFGGGPGYDDRSSNPPRKRRRFWKIRTAPRVVVRTLWSPSAKLIARLRDVYVNTMINMAGKNGALTTVNVFRGKRIPRALEAAPAQAYSFTEVENRIILEIYKALKVYHS